MYKLFSHDEEVEEIRPRAARIFNPDVCGMSDDYFLNKEWGMCLLPDGIFGTCRDDDGMSVEGKRNNRVFLAMLEAIESLGRQRVYVCGLPWNQKRTGTFVDATGEIFECNTSKSYSGVSDIDDVQALLEDVDWFGNLPLILFDDTFRWGYASCYDEFSVLGGDADFMARFYERAGGQQVVKDTFYAYDTEGWWCLSYVEPRSPDVKTPTGYVCCQAVYDIVGWEGPVYTPEMHAGAMADPYPDEASDTDRGC